MWLELEQQAVGPPKGLVQPWGGKATIEMGLEGCSGISWRRDRRRQAFYVEGPGGPRPQRENWSHVFGNCPLRGGVQHVGWVTEMRLEELVEGKSRRVLGGILNSWILA